MKASDRDSNKEKKRIEFGLAVAESSLNRLLDDVGCLMSDQSSRGASMVANGSFTRRVSSDRLTVYLDLFPPSEGGEPLESLAVFKALKDDGIENVLEENIIGAVSACNRDGAVIQRVVAAQGVPPKPAKDGSVRYLFPLKAETEFMPDKHGRIDYRDRGIIMFVEPGTDLAYLDPPVEGEPGKDVYGKTIPVAKTKKFHLIPGKGVKTEDGRIFKSVSRGQPVLQGQELSVRDVYVVPGDVNMATGNVDFNGSVKVNGSVMEGFSVKCGGDLEIRGVVESGIINAAGDAAIKAVIGEKSSVQVGGSLKIRFIQGGKISVGRDIDIASYALHSNVSSGGIITVAGRKGIIGGCMTALKKIDSSVAGSEMGTPTVLEVGSSSRFREELFDLEKKISRAQEDLDRIYRVLKSVLPKYRREAAVPSFLVERLKVVGEKKDEISAMMRVWKDRQMAIRNQMLDADGVPPVVAVRQKVYPGVEITIRGSRRVVDGEMRFCTFSKNDDTEKIEIGTYM